MNTSLFAQKFCVEFFVFSLLAVVMFLSPLIAQAQSANGGAEFVVNASTDNDQIEPKVATLANGDFVVIWASLGQDGSGYGGYGRLFDRAGNAISSEFQINTFTSGDQFPSHVAPLANGGFVVLTESIGQEYGGTSSDYGIFAQLFDEYGNKVGSEFHVNTNSEDDQFGSTVVPLQSGNFIAAWTDKAVGSPADVRARIYAENGTPIGTEILVSGNGQKEGPTITQLANGRIIMVWNSWQEDGSAGGVYGQLMENDGTLVGTQFQVNQNTSGDEGRSFVLALPNGNFIALRMQDDHGVYGRLYDENATPLTSEFLVTADETNQKERFSAVLYDPSTILLTWNVYERDGSSLGVYGQFLDLDGQQIGTDFQMNVYSTGPQRATVQSVAQLQDGVFVATWESQQGTSPREIVARIFNPLESVTLTTNADAFVRAGQSNRNEGANPHLMVRSDGNNRALIGFDASEVAAFVTEHENVSAELVLTIAENGNNWGTGRTVDAHPLVATFAEGNGKGEGLPPAQATRGTGSGVTWNCAIDTAIENQVANCNPQWNGGTYGAATASPVTHTNNQTGEVRWDVTADVLNGRTEWLIRKTNENQNGRIEYYSREGAVDVSNMTLAPRLILIGE